MPINKHIAAGLFTFIMFSCGAPHRFVSSDDPYSGMISISGAWALYPLVVEWAETYQALHPDIRIDVAAGGAGKGIADALAGAVDLGMVSRDIALEEINRGAWWISVARDAVVPVINSAHPLLDEILNRGLSRDEFRAIWVGGNISDWSSLLHGKSGYPIHLYTRSDACGAAQTWAQFLGNNQEDLNGVGIYGDPGLAEAVRGDSLGLGYNNINFAYDRISKTPVEGLTICPVDLNGNGVVDPDESFYFSLDEVTEAIEEDRYPSPPTRDLHLVSLGYPVRPVVRTFLYWVLREGQDHVKKSGYISLSKAKLSNEQHKLNGVVISEP